MSPLKLPRLLPPSTFTKALLSNPSHLSSTPQIIPINATWFMPNDPQKRTGAASHVQLRIPHSRFFDIDVIKDASINLPHMLPPVSVYVEAMRKLKIRREDWLVFYDSWENGILSAPRAAWTARVMGHQGGVSVLNNFKVYVEQNAGPVVKGEEGITDYEGRELSKDEEYPENITAELDRVIDYEHVVQLAKQNLQLSPGEKPSIQIMDARPNGRFTGQDPEPRPGLSSGHIPASISVPFSSLLDADKALLSGDKLREVLLKAGVEDDGKEKITSCGTGVTAAVIELALLEGGFKETEGKRRVYDGSWTEWAGKAETELIVKDV